MDALLSAFLACLLCEIGGTSQKLALALAERFDRDKPILAGLACAVSANAILSAVAGWFLAGYLTSDARSLFLAVALALGGTGLLLPAKPAESLAGWRTGPATTAMLASFILGFGDASQFIILGLATRMADPVGAAIGGALGVLAASVPVVILRRHVPNAKLASGVRRAGGGILMLTGAILGLSAMKLL